MSEHNRSAWAGFKEFLMRGNVIELAVAVVIGVAFTNIVNSVVEGLISPVVGAFGSQDLDAYQLCLRGPCESGPAGEVISGIPLRWGSVASASLTFLITAAVVYFLMVLPMQRYRARQEAKAPAKDSPAQKTELEILTEIRDELIARRTGRPTGAEEPAGRVSAQRPAPGGAAEGPGTAGDENRE